MSLIRRRFTERYPFLRIVVSSNSNDPVKQVLRRIRRKTQRIRDGGRCVENQNQVGLVPKKGWRKRNMNFWGRTVLPSLFARRGEQPGVPDFPSLAREQVGITWIGHASFLIQCGGKNILVDPNWGMWLSLFKRMRHPGIPLDALPKIDLVLISHAHHDHLHLQTLREVADRQPILVPRGVGSLVKRRGFSEVHELEYWDTWSDGDLEVTLTPTMHWGARFIHDTHRQFGGFVIDAGGTTVYHAGDSAMFDGFREIGLRHSIDVALMPIGAYDAPSGREVHMNPEEALDAFAHLGAKWMVPMHYGTFPLGGEPLHEPVERLEREAVIREIRERVVVMDEGDPHVF